MLYRGGRDGLVFGVDEGSNDFIDQRGLKVSALDVRALTKLIFDLFLICYRSQLVKPERFGPERNRRPDHIKVSVFGMNRRCRLNYWTACRRFTHQSHIYLKCS